MHQFLRFIFGIKFYMFRTVPLSIIRSFSLYTQQWCMSYSLRADLYDIYHCCVYSEKTDGGQRNCPKHVEFYSRNKFEKLVHLVGFIIRIYHDARPPERQISCTCFEQIIVLTLRLFLYAQHTVVYHAGIILK